MSTLKMCRLWCVHSELKNDGDLAICSACGCPHLFQGDHVVPKDMAKEECDCDDCKRDFWRYRPPTLPLQMPWRHEGERRLLAWVYAHAWMREVETSAREGERKAPEWMSKMSQARFKEHAAAGMLAECVRWVDVLPELKRLADERDALARELHAEAWRDAAISHEATAENLQGLLADARRELAAAVCAATALRAERDALVAAARLALEMLETVWSCVPPPYEPGQTPADQFDENCVACQDVKATKDALASAITKAKGAA